MNKKAFTLIEILVVILIIGTLTALSVAQYTNSQKKAKIQIFESNINNIVKTLNVYRGNNILSGNQKESYPVSLSDQKFKSLFKQEPINPYTNKSMLSDNPSESGIQYVSDGSSYSMCIVQQDVDDVNNNGVVEEVLPLSTKTACIGNTQTSVGVTFARNSVAYTSNGAQVGVNVPRFEQGKFGQGILIEEGTTNALLFRTGGTNIQNWYNYTSPSTATTYTITNVNTPYGPGVRIIGSNIGRIGKSLDTKVINLNSSVASFSIYFKPNKKSGILKAWWDTETASGTRKYGTFGNQPVDLTNLTVGQWYRLEVSVNIAPEVFGNPTGYGSILVWVECPNSSADVEIVAPQLESKSYVTSWTDGTRAADNLTVSTASIINPQEGTVELIWIPKQPINAIDGQGTSPKIFQIGEYAYNNSLVLWAFYAGVAKEPHLRIYVKGSSSSGWSIAKTVIGSGKGWYKVGEPIYLAVKWTNGNTFWVSVNGVTYGPYTISDPLTGWAGNKMWLPTNSNAIYDEVRISNRARTDAEIQAAYRNNQSLPVDAWTTLKLDFNGDLSTQSGVIP